MKVSESPDYATPAWVLALARLLDMESCNLKQGGDKPKAARRLREYADILERKI